VSERLERNRAIISEFRANSGLVGGQFEGTPLLLLTTVGARSGEPRTSPMTYLADGERWIVFAANGGRPVHPAWYHNLGADPHATVEVGDRRVAVTAAVLDGPERERYWAAQVERAPYFANFAQGTTREIPVIALAASS
jgi:deazaflavin-dependent oxidoreductase (nitroreductase family)